MELFPDAYNLSKLKFVAVAGMGGWVNGRWEWGDFGILSANSSGAAMVAVHDLRSFLEVAHLVGMELDEVEWLAKADKKFSIKSSYLLSNAFHVPFGPEKEFFTSFSSLWNLVVPQKIKAFGWRCFLNRLHTRDLLLVRGISFSNSIACVCCGLERKSLYHIFLGCGVSALIWKEIISWIGFVDFGFGCIMGSFLKWCSFCKSKKVIKPGREGTIWLAILWSIWKLRNGIIFRNDSWSVSDTVWSIKTLV
ncbi:uncharacterized protein LOC131614731 [Vicia villosa]|uniref:uncharacterized protein LOC131614731 n=1 Tax=Vicia villosa TaxID=3911 RepID=UPI00273B7D94|nr:uncharacterized protein LOC131614731 [Vicia villosa]